MRKLLIIGILGLGVGLYLPSLSVFHLSIPLHTISIIFSLGALGACALMFTYSLVGKFHHRDRMLSMIEWKGNERVLDVGSNRGLLLIAAAKNLSTGRAYGIDIWKTAELTSDSISRAKQNISMEGVEDRAEIRNNDARNLDFADESIDVILSNSCLSGISSFEDRAKACREMVRVLRPNGVIVLSDYKYTNEYAQFFKSAGFDVKRTWPSFLIGLPPLRILKIQKSATNSST